VLVSFLYTSSVCSVIDFALQRLACQVDHADVTTLTRYRVIEHAIQSDRGQARATVTKNSDRAGFQPPRNFNPAC